MILRNVSTDTVLAAQAEYADGFWKQFKALRLQTFTDSEEALIIPKHKQIDTFFYSQKIEVVVLDAQKYVLSNFMMEPFQTSPPFVKGYYFVLLDPNNPQAALVQAGHQLNWQHDKYVEFSAH